MTATETAVRTLLAVGIVLLACNVVGWLVGRIGQPRVVGELLAGIALGPSVLGLALPEVVAHLFPEPVIGALRVVAQLGLVLFLLLVGMETTPGDDRLEATRVGGVATASVVVPLVLAAALALGLYPAYGEGSPMVAFVLFVGAAVSVTALPVLARLLRETGLTGTRVGATALVAAAANDVVAWVLVAVAATVVEADGVGPFLRTAGGAAVLVLVLLAGVRPLLARWGAPPLWVPVVVALLSAWAAEQVGIHAIFGAFLAGLAMPRSESWRDHVRSRLDPTVTAVLLPVFFVVVGLSTRVDTLTPLDALVFAAVLVVAVVGKVGGVGVTARLFGDGWRDAATLGVLMNARGVTEIVVLTVGLDLGLIGPTMFTVLVLVAVVTTFMTAPLLRTIRGPRRRTAPQAPARARPRSTRPG
ncbi:cation:proton antiporter [Pseudonocardia sp. WMMC193]|uniref:cation:proton antiporter n=1 Tax=Pseudonocardia sp. WMMC193 TaxID=2911965 RepID=UPI001F012731|nr:cation:proton antiporter [Pseudonocardia sp. WMMC193]MCF7548197.1 cation:proton antiporter [Pseudonocardia sp. WMMC193]